MQYPVVAEIWSLFEGTLQQNAKKLVEDIARQNHADPKELWDKVRPRIKVGLLDVDLPEDLQVTCAHMGSSEGAVRTRCRAPCVLGFSACHKHVQTPLPTSTEKEQVDRILDFEGQPYFLTKHNLAIDKFGQIKGYVEDGALTLFIKAKAKAKP